MTRRKSIRGRQLVACFVTLVALLASCLPHPGLLSVGESKAPLAADRFFGHVTTNGVPAPAGVSITATIGGTVCGQTTVKADSTYVLDVVSIGHTAGCGTEGASVSFTVDGYAAGSGTWSSGKLTELHLDASTAPNRTARGLLAGAQSLQTSAACSAQYPGRAVATFHWVPVAAASSQWLDLSLFDNGFAPGTFIGAGPLSGGENTFTWDGLLPESVHYWRVNSLVSGVWQPSETGVFVTTGCVPGAAVLLEVPQACSTAIQGAVRVQFTWQPSAWGGTQQWLDLSLQDNEFLPGTFIGGGPLPVSAGSLSWDGLKPGLPHYWRVNTRLGTATWAPSETGGFTTLRCPVVPVAPTPRPTSAALAPQPTPTVPPTPTPPATRKVILIQGIDSSSSCDDDLGDPNSFAARRASVSSALQGSGVGWYDVYGFSYGGRYQECFGDAALYSTVALPLRAVTPVYGPLDTCFGVEQAAQRLGLLVSRLIALYPGATFDLVAHSMGGLVASYYVATQDASFVRKRIHSVVLLDSPVNPGLELSNPRSACSEGNQSWPDMQVGSPVIATINDQGGTTLRTTFVCVLATGLIGQALPGCPVVYAQNYISGTGGAVLGTILAGVACVLAPWTCPAVLVGPLAGAYVLDTAPVHSAVWHDPVALKAIADTVLAP